jgi:hypothetical protein
MKPADQLDLDEPKRVASIRIATMALSVGLEVPGRAML